MSTWSRLPAFVGFQSPRRVAHPPAGSEWLHEPYVPGRRVQVRIDDGRVGWLGWGRRDLSPLVPELSAPLSQLTPCILDAYLCPLDEDGVVCPSRLEAVLDGRARGGATGPLAVFVFDLLFWAGEDLRVLALRERRAWLRGLLDPGSVPLSPRLRYVEPLASGPAPDWARLSWPAGAEGIVSKRLDAPYRAGRLFGSWTRAPRPAADAVAAVPVRAVA
jgi:bifunctional non-homologous end joining protein LigD